MKALNQSPQFHLCLNTSFGFSVLEALFTFSFSLFFSFSYGSDICSQVHPLLQNHSHKGIDRADQQLETRIRIPVFLKKKKNSTSLVFSSSIIITSVEKTLLFFPALCFYNISVYLVFSVHMFSFSGIFILLR